jgi:hypothetical protein
VLDVTGDFARRLVQAGGALAISEDLGDVTEVVLDAILGEASDEFTDRVKLQQRVLSQVVRDRERLTVVVGLPRGGVVTLECRFTVAFPALDDANLPSEVTPRSSARPRRRRAR